MRVRLSSVLLVLAALALGAGITAAAVLYAGFYDVAATRQHLAATYELLQIGLRESIQRHARGIEVPPLGDPGQVGRGLVLYRQHCVQCHGAPGVPPEPFALGLTPLAKNFALAARERRPAELYWVVRNGIKMTGMPAWEFRLAESDLWAVVAGLEALAMMTPAEYAERARALPSNASALSAEPPPGAPADPRRGKRALSQYACTMCHVIPGVVGAENPVGPPLERMALRQYIAGMLPNTPENMARWLREPQAVNPRSAMPNLGVSERDAHDMAAYLYTLQ
ncbi:MAG TPA: c-type cytochrome [Burkholderiales bacterium]|nr:c-type cytochrome [Burkholderiales bacterium]